MKNFSVILLLVILFLITAESNAQKIIVNSSNTELALSSQQIKNIFLGNSSVWGNGNYIQIVDYSATSEIRERFSKKVLNLSPRRVSMMWIKVTLSGKSILPKILDSESEIVNFISKNRGAVGYIESDIELPSSVKLLTLTN